MKIRGLLIATAAFAVLAGLLYWSDHRKPSTDADNPAEAAPSILKLDENSITKLELKKKDAPEIQLTKSGPDWKITQPKSLSADQSTVSGMLSTLASLDSERMVEGKSSDLQRYGLEHPSIEVDVTEKDNKSQRLLLGDDTPTGGASYAALAGDPRVFTIAAYHRTSIDKTVNDLRDKRLLTVSPGKISQLEIAGANGDIEFGRSKDAWQILKPKPMRADSYVVGGLVSKLTDARMDLSGSDSAAKEWDSEFAKGTAVATVKVTDEASTQQLQIRKHKDLYYAESSIVGGAFKINSDLADAVDKKLEDFRNKKLFDFGYSEPSKLEVHSGSKTLSLMRGGQDWWDNGKKMDEDSVSTLVSNLRELSADKFADSGFATAEIDVTVTDNDGRTIEKVLISKSGADYIAKRDNDPVLYQLPSSSVDELRKLVDGIKLAIPAIKPGK